MEEKSITYTEHLENKVFDLLVQHSLDVWGAVNAENEADRHSDKLNEATRAVAKEIVALVTQ